MSRVPYGKTALTYPDQLARLKSRGLVVADDAKALHLLKQISYYRLSANLYPLLEEPKSAHLFKSGATLETAFRLYCFDRELRKIVAAELEKIEVAIRSQLVYFMAHRYGPFWISDAANFRPGFQHARMLAKIEPELTGSDEEFMRAFWAKYSDPHPPCWMTAEIVSFGVISRLYQNLRDISVKQQIADGFALPYRVFESWTHALVYLRNICAHHARLWNREFQIRPQIPRSPRAQWLVNSSVTNDRSYFMMSMIVYLLNSVNSRHRFRQKFQALLAKYPNVDPLAMGFLPDWKTEPLWQV